MEKEERRGEINKDKRGEINKDKRGEGGRGGKEKGIGKRRTEQEWWVGEEGEGVFALLLAC